MQELYLQDWYKHNFIRFTLLNVCANYALPDFPTKDEDSMGQNTPQFVNIPGHDLSVQGAGFVGQYQPLTRGNLEEKLNNEYDVLYLIFLIPRTTFLSYLH